jgi:Tfp pilus assembly protein PilZ
MARGGVEKRQHKRIPMNLKVRFRRSTDEVYSEGHTENISAGGLFIVSQDTYEMGAQLECEVYDNSNKLALHGQCIVRWTHYTATADAPAIGFGVEVVSIDKTTRLRVDEIIDTYLTTAGVTQPDARGLTSSQGAYVPTLDVPPTPPPLRAPRWPPMAIAVVIAGLLIAIAILIRF